MTDDQQKPEPEIELTPTTEIGAEPAEPKRSKKRPKIDWDLVETMLRAGASGNDIADYYGVVRQTIYENLKREKGLIFGEWMLECKAATRHMLRMAQLKEAQGYKYEKVEKEDIVVRGKKVGEKITTTIMQHPPNTALLIWLGKNTLGQSENPETGAGFGSVPAYRMVGDDDEEDDAEDKSGAVDYDDLALPEGNSDDDYNEETEEL